MARNAIIEKKSSSSDEKFSCLWKYFHRLCFTKLKLLLIAIEARGENGGGSSLAINPGPNVKIDSTTQGFFIAESADDVKRSDIEIQNIKLYLFQHSSCSIFLMLTVHEGIFYPQDGKPIISRTPEMFS